LVAKGFFVWKRMKTAQTANRERTEELAGPELTYVPFTTTGPLARLVTLP
jgi:hypothetical protein